MAIVPTSYSSSSCFGLAGMCDEKGSPVVSLDDGLLPQTRLKDIVCFRTAQRMQALAAFNDCEVQVTDGTIACSRSVLSTVSTVLR